MTIPQQNQYPLSTNELARMVGVKPETIRVRLCSHGSYFGLVPRKLRNGRLIWPADSAERLLKHKP